MVHRPAFLILMIQETMKTRVLFLAALLPAVLSSCTKAVVRDTEVEVQERTVPSTPGNINKIPATLKCSRGETFQLSVNDVKWADHYEWIISEEASSLLSIIDGQGTNMITVKAADTDGIIPRRSISVVASNDLGHSSPRLFLAELSIGNFDQPEVPELPGYSIKQYGNKYWMTTNCKEAGNDGNLGKAWDLTQYTVSGMTADAISAINSNAGRFYTWYEAMTGISDCTAEQCVYKPGYSGKDDMGNPFTLDGSEEGEFNIQIKGCCPDGWHIANANDWWDLLNAIKTEYDVTDDFKAGGFTFMGGHDKKPENAVTKEIFYKNGCTVKNMGNVGAWLRGGNGRVSDGGVWNQTKTELSDAGENIAQFVSGATEVGFDWYPTGRVAPDGTFSSSSIGKWGLLWTPGQENAGFARSLCISGTSLNLAMMNGTKRAEANKLSRLNVRCVKNYE